MQIDDRRDGGVDGADDGDGFLPVREDFAGGQVHRRVFAVVAGVGQQFGFGHRVDDAADVGPVERAAAHAAGLDVGVQGALPEPFRREVGGGNARQRRLGVVDRVDVALLQQHSFVVGADEDRSEGMMSERHRAAGDGIRPFQVAQDLVLRRLAGRCGGLGGVGHGSGR